MKNQDESGTEGYCSFLWMPRDLQGGNDTEGVITVIFIPVGTLDVLALRVWKTKDSYVIFIFEDRSDCFSKPDIHDSIANHAGIAASTGCAERMIVIYEEFPILSLDNKPGLVIRKYRASAVELLNVEGAGLSARWGDCNLYMEG